MGFHCHSLANSANIDVSHSKPFRTTETKNRIISNCLILNLVSRQPENDVVTSTLLLLQLLRFLEQKTSLACNENQKIFAFIASLFSSILFKVLWYYLLIVGRIKRWWQDYKYLIWLQWFLGSNDNRTWWHKWRGEKKTPNEWRCESLGNQRHTE